MNSRLIMRYPAAWHGQMWREGAPFGSGLIGGMVYGGIWQENILINHAMLWRGGRNDALPDISGRLPFIRRLLDEKKIREADSILSDALKERGYCGDFVRPTPVADIIIVTPVREMFSHYRRIIDMDRAEVTVCWKEKDTGFIRSTFASRANNRIFTHYTCDRGKFDTKIRAALHDPETMGDTVIPQQESYAAGQTACFAAYNDSVYRPGDYGLVCKVFSDGEVYSENGYISVHQASEILIVAEVFIEEPRCEAFARIKGKLAGTFNYDEEMKEHLRLYEPLFKAVDFSVSDRGDTSNEELLLNSFEGRSSNEMMEKLYAYGRYLFICSTSDKDTLPCHLTGLFNGSYQSIWAFYMYNVNFQMIYWQALSGNLPGFLRLALDYTEAMVPDFRENAKKIFGCRGILVNSVNAPDSGLYKCQAHHIVNWTGGAAWAAQHFFDYYRYTGDEDYLKQHAMPFMYETALFYEDFAVEAPDGYYDLYPSVSPENTASNIAVDQGTGGIETSKNATMEFALLKELLTNLLKGSKITGLYPEKRETWKNMMSRIRPYMVNEDGAVKEWTDPFYRDNYCHRHHSNLYPVFPGCEITKKDKIYPAFERAEDLRLQYGLFDQSSWSVAYMAGIAARMERGNLALTELQAIGRTCLMNNFLTVSNDWRRMGPVCCADFRRAPFQIDGNIGVSGVINEMLLQSRQEDVFLLPAKPEQWEKGHITGLLARGKIVCDIYWEKNGGYARLRHDGVIHKIVRIGSGFCLEDAALERDVVWSGVLEVHFRSNI